MYKDDTISSYMIKITAKISIGESGGTLNTVTSAESGINVSGTLDKCIGRHEQIQRPFILGRSRLGKGDCFTKKANYFISRQLSDSDGNFSNDVVIDIIGSEIMQLTIIFNKRKNEYPKSIVVDGKTYYVDNPTWTSMLTSADTHTIKISNWNKSSSPLVISSIYTDLSIYLDDSNLLDFESNITDRSDITKPSYGIISNTGSLSFIDKNSEVLSLISQQIVSSHNVISAYLENTTTNAKEQIAYFNTQKWSYNNSRSIVSVSLKDDLEEWQDINVPEINYTPSVSKSQTAKWFYDYLYSKTPEKYRMLPFSDLDEKTQDALTNTIIQYPIMESSSLWSQWDKLCQLCFLHIYKRKDGITVCVSD